MLVNSFQRSKLMNALELGETLLQKVQKQCLQAPFQFTPSYSDNCSIFYKNVLVVLCYGGSIADVEVNQRDSRLNLSRLASNPEAYNVPAKFTN